MPALQSSHGLLSAVSEPTTCSSSSLDVMGDVLTCFCETVVYGAVMGEGIVDPIVRGTFLRRFRATYGGSSSHL